MNLSETQINNFIQEVKKILSGTRNETFIEFEGHPDELKRYMEKEIGPAVENLFLLTTIKDKKDWIEAGKEKEWPNPNADFISSIKVVHSEDRFRA